MVTELFRSHFFVICMDTVKIMYISVKYSILIKHHEFKMTHLNNQIPTNRKGYRAKDKMHRVKEKLSTCPQFDVLPNSVS